MTKIIAGMNVTLDGFCDHTAMTADEETHQHYNDVLRNGAALLYGRTTYQMMESYWPMLVEKPSGQREIDEFAQLIDDIPKVVFSTTLTDVTWKNATLKKEIRKEEILELKKQASKDLFVGSPSLIVAFTQLGLVDEFHLCVHPVMAGKGLRLFKNIADQVNLKLLKTKTFASGVIVLYYEVIKSKK